MSRVGFKGRVFAAAGCAFALVVGVTTPAEARRVVIDQGQFLPPDTFSDGCTVGQDCTSVTMPFTVNFGAGATNQAFIYSNGVVSFGSEIPLGANPNTTDFTSYGVPVIAPLLSTTNVSVVGSDTPSFIGFTPTLPPVSNLFIVGFNQDPLAESGEVAPISWLILSATDNDIRFEFVHGMSNTQDGVTTTSTPTGQSLGYSLLGQTFVQNNPDLSTSEIYSFDVRPGSVPEPGVWALMLAGFGGIGAMVRNRRRLAATPA
jgi:hypothetical protein